RRRGETWWVATRWRGRFGQDDGIDWFSLADDPNAVAVKSNPVRQVWRVRFGEACLYAKVIRVAGWADRLRCLFRGPQALGEWRCGVYAESAGIPCVGLVACGERRGMLGVKSSVLITEALDGAVPLPEAWRDTLNMGDPALGNRIRRALVDAVADLLARAHAAHFLHRDGHPGNILVWGVDRASPRVSYVDLYGARIGRAIPDELAAGGLAQLDQWFARHASRSLRLRFLRQYLAGRCSEAAATGATIRHWTKLTERARRRHARRLHAHRDRRLQRSGKYFSRFKLTNGWDATVTLRFRNRDEFPAPMHRDRTEDAWRVSLERFVQDGPALADPPAQMRPARWCASGYAQSLAWTVSGSPAWRAFQTGHAMRHRDIACVWPLAALNRRRRGLVTDCVLLVEERPGASNLAGLLDSRQTGDQQAERLGDQPERAAVFESLGRLLADAADRGLRWSQPKLSALWVSWPGRGQPMPRVLIGRFDGISFHRQPSVRHGAEMVEALARCLDACPTATPGDRQSLVEAYRNRVGLGFRSPDDRPGRSE
ncbi:MAG: lipopolysaccharide kinase InaA family protein, partial [Planctomycetota bacterium]